MSERWTAFLDLGGRPGWQNMAIDQAMLDRAGAGERWLRLYRWQPHCLSFGRHEPAERRYDRRRIDQLGLDVVRRPTGGRAVWHADELTYAVALPSRQLGGLREAYEEIHRMLSAALTCLGAQVDLAQARRVAGLDAGACFASPVGGEIVAEGRKLVGSAQLREGTGLLQHGSILLSGRQTLVSDLTLGKAHPDLAGGLDQAIGRNPGAEETAEVVTATAAHRWGGSWERVKSPAALLERARSYEGHFRSPAWIWKS